MDAADLTAGYRLLNDDASWAEVVSVEVVAEELEAYNLTVADYHTYFVAANENASPVWVHNSCLINDLGLDNRLWKTFDADVTVDGNSTQIFVNLIESVDDNVPIPVSQYKKVLDGMLQTAKENGSEYLEISGIAAADSVERLFRRYGTPVVGSNGIEMIRILVD